MSFFTARSGLNLAFVKASYFVYEVLSFERYSQKFTKKMITTLLLLHCPTTHNQSKLLLLDKCGRQRNKGSGQLLFLKR